MRVEAESAYVLHSRPYRENSLLVDLLTRRHGRVRVVARSARRQKGATRLSAFIPFAVSWGGRSDLKTLHHVEPEIAAKPLWGERLFTGIYLNELLLRLLPEHDPHELLYDHYQSLIRDLAEIENPEMRLRVFEFMLLKELGYGLVLDMDAESGEPVVPSGEYLFDAEMGVTRHFERRIASAQCVFSGAHLLAIAADDYDLADVRRSAKRLARLALQPHLGNQPLRSRELFMGLRPGLEKNNGET